MSTCRGRSLEKKVVVWWVFIYPVAVHRPCGHVCAPKNKCGTISQITSHDHDNNTNNPVSMKMTTTTEQTQSRWPK